MRSWAREVVARARERVQAQIAEQGYPSIVRRVVRTTEGFRAALDLAMASRT